MILLKAYTEINFGDDLLIDILTKRYPDTKFVMAAPNIYKQIFKDRKNIIIFNRRGFLYRLADWLIRHLKLKISVEKIINIFCCGSVYVGGSLFIENKEKHEKSTRNFCNSLNKKFSSVLGCNFGPYEDEKFYNDYKNIFKNVTDICFRDKKSFNLFKNQSNIRYAPDIAFNLQRDINIKEEKQIFISVIDFKMRPELLKYEKEYKSSVIKIINRFTSLGCKVVLSSFCKYEGDEDMVYSIINDNSITCKNMITTLFYNGNINEITKSIKSSEYVLGTRFHSVVIGNLFEKKVLPILYSNKTILAIKSYGFNMECIDIRNMNNIDYLNIENKFSKCNSEALLNVVSEAEKQFEKLDCYLKSSK